MLITKYRAAANRGITTAMLRDWIKPQTTIEIMHRGVRKNRVAVPSQEPILEARLVELFAEVRKAGRKITRRWFVHQGQQIYGHLYPDRVVKNVERRQDTVDSTSLMDGLEALKNAIESAFVSLLKSVRRQVNYFVLYDFF